jgi:hypothetical protein
MKAEIGIRQAHAAIFAITWMGTHMNHKNPTSDESERTGVRKRNPLGFLMQKVMSMNGQLIPIETTVNRRISHSIIHALYTSLSPCLENRSRKR